MKAKLKFRDTKNTKSHCGKHSWIFSNFYGYQTQSKMKTTFSLFFTYSILYSLSMLILVPKGLIKMKTMMDYHAWFWVRVIFWCSGAFHKLHQILPKPPSKGSLLPSVGRVGENPGNEVDFATGSIWEFTTIKIKSLQEILCKNSVWIYNYWYNYVIK